MNEIGKHFDLYQFFVYLFPGMLFFILWYFLFLFKVIDISYLQWSINIGLFQYLEWNLIVALIGFFVISYFLWHMIHTMWIFIFKYINRFNKGNKEESNKKKEDAFDVYLKKHFSVEEDGIKMDYMLTYLFLDSFLESKKVKLEQTLLWVYKSLFVVVLLIGSVITLLCYWTGNCCAMIIALFLTVVFCHLFYKQANSYYNSSKENNKKLLYLYFKKKKNTI